MKNIILKKEGNYTLIARVDEQNSVYEYVVAYCYDDNNDAWTQGVYFNVLDKAMEYLQKKTAKFDSTEELFADAGELADAFIDFFSEQSNEAIASIFCDDLEWEIRKMFDRTTQNKIIDYLEDCINNGDETALLLKKELVAYVVWTGRAMIRGSMDFMGAETEEQAKEEMIDILESQFKGEINYYEELISTLNDLRH